MERIAEAIKANNLNRVFDLLVTIPEAKNAVNEEGKNLLHIACEHCSNPNIIILLLNKGVSVNQQDQNYNTPLHLAVKNGPEMTEALLQGQPDFDLINSQGYCPMATVILHGNTDTIQILLNNDDDLNKVYPHSEGRPLLHVVIRDISPELLQFLYERGAFLANTDKNGQNLLHRAVYFQDKVPIVSKLIELGVSVHLKDKNGITVLSIAAYSAKNPEVVELLLKQGANPNTVCRNGLSALHYSAKHLNLGNSGPFIIQKILRQRAVSINKGDKKEDTPLHYACRSNNAEAAIALFNAGANIDWKNSEGKTPLDLSSKVGVALIKEAIINNADKHVQRLLSALSDINSVNKDGMTPLSIAAQCAKNSEVVELFLSAGANPGVACRKGQIPLHYAAQRQNGGGIGLSIVKKLLAVPRTLIDDVDFLGNTALHHACRANNVDTAIALIKIGANVDCKNGEGETPLELSSKVRVALLKEAILENDLARVQELLATIQDVNTVDSDGQNLLHVASEYGLDPKIVSLLIDKGVPVDLQDAELYTPLHYAVLNGPDITTALLVGNPRLDLVNSEYKYALEIAILEGEEDTILALLNKGANLNDIPKDSEETIMERIISKISPERLEFLRKNGAELARLDQNGESLLHKVIDFQEQTSIVEKLIQLGLSIDLKDKCGITALSAAAHLATNPEVVEVFLSNGADPNITSRSGKKALHWAAQQKNEGEVGPSIIKKLLSQPGVSVDDVDNLGDTPLHHACRSGNMETAIALFNAGANIDCENSKGKTPLDLSSKVGVALIKEAIINDDINCVQGLLPTLSDVNVVNEKGKNLLHIACELSKEPKIIDALIKAGVSINYQDSLKDTPLHLAVENGPEITEATLRGSPDFDLKNDSGKFPLEVAILKENKETIQALINHGDDLNKIDDSRLNGSILHFTIMHITLETLQLLKSLGANLNIENDNRKNLLHSAVTFQDKTPIVEELIGSGVPIDHKDNIGMTPLGHAAFTANPEVVQQLLAYGANPNAMANDGKTPLHYAAQRQSDGEVGPSIIKKLLGQEGVSVNVTDNGGNTPLHLACQTNNWESALTLISEGAEIYSKNCNGERPLDLSERVTMALKDLEEEGNTLKQEANTFVFGEIQENQNLELPGMTQPVNNRKRKQDGSSENFIRNPTRSVVNTRAAKVPRMS